MNGEDVEWTILTTKRDDDIYLLFSMPGQKIAFQFPDSRWDPRHVDGTEIDTAQALTCQFRKFCENVDEAGVFDPQTNALGAALEEISTL